MKQSAKKEGLQFCVGFSYGIGQSIPKDGSGVPECSLTIQLGLHIFGSGNSKERPGCRTEGTRRDARLHKIREIGWHGFFDGAEGC